MALEQLLFHRVIQLVVLLILADAVGSAVELLLVQVWQVALIWNQAIESALFVDFDDPISVEPLVVLLLLIRESSLDLVPHLLRLIPAVIEHIVHFVSVLSAHST